MSGRGHVPWYGHPTLSRPMTILGVERRWFILSAVLGLSLWNAMNSLSAAALTFAIAYVAGLLAARRDPNMLSIIRGAASSRSRYDPGKPASWHLRITR